MSMVATSKVDTTVMPYRDNWLKNKVTTKSNVASYISMQPDHVVTTEVKRMMVLATILNLAFYGLKDSPPTKRVVKKVIRATKKYIKTFTMSDKKSGLTLSRDAIDISCNAANKSHLMNTGTFTKVNSGFFLERLREHSKAYADAMTEIGVSKTIVDELITITTREVILLDTIVYTNRLITEIEKYLDFEYEDTRTLEDIKKELKAIMDENKQ